jgi:hypothetical protein
MKRLFDREFVRETKHGSGPALDNYSGSDREFDLKDHFVLTDTGREYLACRREWQKYVNKYLAPPDPTRTDNDEREA